MERQIVKYLVFKRKTINCGPRFIAKVMNDNDIKYYYFVNKNEQWDRIKRSHEGIKYTVQKKIIRGEK